MQVLAHRLEELGPAVSSSFSVGGVSVRVIGNPNSDAALAPSLEPFRIEGGASDVHISIEWANCLPLTCGRQLFDSGTTWRLYESDVGFQFDFNAPIIGEQPYKRLIVDNRFRSATLQMNGGCLSRICHVVAPLGYPLDELLITHRLTQERAIELHGVGIVCPNGASNLFVGHSGAGKSTTARLWTATQDVEILSDDRIIVRKHPGYMRMYGTPWHGEAMFASPNSAPLTRIMILEHGQGNVLTRLSPSQAVAELFARSFVPMHRHEYVESALEFLQDVAESIPCYRYSFEPDVRAVEKILNLHE